SADVYVPEKRACMHKVALVHAIAGLDQARRTTPALFGLGHTSEELRAMYLNEPLRTGYTRDERLDVIAQLEETTIGSLSSAGEEAAEHGRRRYYGLLVVCDATDEVLVRLGAERPTDCLRFKPRPPKHDAPASAPSATSSPRPASRPGRPDPKDPLAPRW